MCELRVVLEGELVFDDCIYAKAEEGDVTLMNILEETKIIENCTINLVHIGKETLTLHSHEAWSPPHNIGVPKE